MVRNPRRVCLLLGTALVILTAVAVPEPAAAKVESRPERRSEEAPPTGAARQPGQLARVRGFVGSIFGDPVSGARVVIGVQEALTDVEGRFVLVGLDPGPRRLEVKAAGFHPLSLEMTLDAGENILDLKYDRGLWPEGFAADFHVFFAPVAGGGWKLFGQVGLANGGPGAVYLLAAWVEDPFGQVMADLLAGEQGMRDLVGEAAGAESNQAPRPVVAVYPRRVHRISIGGQPNPVASGVYRLHLEYADPVVWRAGQSRRLVLESTARPDLDWNPHTKN